MGRKKSANVEEKRKAVKVRPIERKHKGKVVEAYRLLEELVKAHHLELESAKIILLWRKGWKPDVDKVLVLARIKKASDLDHAIAAMIGDGYDFAMQLNEEAWPGLSDDKKRQIIDHELTHGTPDLDRDGNQKLDSKERLCWRVRKHPIQEFPEILDRYGVEECLGLNAAAQKAVEDADRPLLAAVEKAAGENGQAEGKKSDWRKLPIDTLKLTANVLAKCGERDVLTLGDFQAFQAKHGDFWGKELGLRGNQAATVVAAFDVFWVEHPEYCQEKPAAA